MYLDPRQFIAAVRAEAAENPDKVYLPPLVWDEDEDDFVATDECVYVERDHGTGELVGSCIVGRALIRCGVPAEKLDVFGISFSTLAARLGIELHPSIIEWGDCVQDRQDSGVPWSEAIEIADSEFPELVVEVV
ncbi:hypothetical protein [Nocardia cyriacigeorgica]|uniref:hypothetical protein n=1 Tax=Nocardia cyriacigeorgica TaxID=135487 RepID=UPI0024571A44|nr:hypothetical protein [Nocardia cyriacigeorgica]